MSFFMKPKKKALRKVAFVAVALFAASVVLGAGLGALGWLDGEGQQAEIDEDELTAYLDELEAEVEANPEDEGALRNLGEFQLSLGNYFAQAEMDEEKAQKYYDKAMETYGKIVDIDPNNPDYWVDKALAAFQVYDIETAQNSVEEVLNLDPDHQDGLNLEAHLKLYEGNYEDAIDNWAKLIERNDISESDEEFYESMISEAKDMKEAAESGFEELEDELDDSIESDEEDAENDDDLEDDNDE